jgi:hypothetical protein
MIQEPFILPPIANIPNEWVAKEDGFTKQIVCPSWSRKGGKYLLTLDKFTRELSCECPGFKYRGTCHHLKVIKFASVKVAKHRKDGVAETSVESLLSFSPEQLGEKQLAVYLELLRHGPKSIREIAEHLNWPEHCVTGRLMELREMEVVGKAGETFDQVTQRRVKLWGVM